VAEIRTLIVDDEPLARRGVRQLLAPYEDFVVAGECRDGREAVRAISTLKPDLVFLDVQMPGLDGLEVIRVCGVERMPPVVFVTAYDAFAVKAFEAHALDYLVKPLGEARFKETIERVRERIRLADAVALAGRLTALLAAGTARGWRGPESSARAEKQGSPRIAVQVENGERLIDAHEIDWIEAEDDCAAIHTDGKRYRVRESLSELESLLASSRFVRIHRSTLVRLDRIREVRDASAGRAAVVVLRDQTTLEVSRRRLSQLRSALFSRT